MSNSCYHLIKENYLASLQGKLIYKDQCTKCFHDPRDDKGIDICLKCLSGSCINGENHSREHYEKTNHPIVLNLKLVEIIISGKDKDTKQELTRLAIGKPGGASLEQIEYDEVYTLKCIICNIELDNSLLAGVVQSIAQENSAFKKQDICEWELELHPCEHTLTLQQTPKNMSQGLLKCHSCDLSTNLWLCLICGNVGCGRRNYDGTGGNNHAIDHSQKDKHCLVVKLGTITSEGNASVYCYNCDNDVADLLLSQHLNQFGIQISDQKKTEKTITELVFLLICFDKKNIDANRNLTLSSILEEGRMLIPLYGPKFTGMKNIGNSCYINSVFQTLFSLPEIEQRYAINGLSHLKTCSKQAVECLSCQLSKLGCGLTSGVYSQKKEVKIFNKDDSNMQLSDDQKYMQEGVAINDLRSMIGKNHSEFKTKQMQDALEYLQYLLDQIEKEEILQKITPKTGQIFEYKGINKLKCLKCGGVKIIENINNEIKLPVLPPTPEQLKKALENQQIRSVRMKEEAEHTNRAPIEDAKLMEEPEYDTTFDASIQLLKAGEIVELNCQKCSQKTNFSSWHYFRTMPKYIIMPTNRLILENWVPKKLNALINVPEEYDFQELRDQGLTSDEFMLEETSNIKQEKQKPNVQVDEFAFLQLVEMGFGENRSTRALQKYENNLEAAMNFLFENMDDQTLDLPLKDDSNQTTHQQKSPDFVDPENLILLEQMGFDSEQSKRALKKLNNNVELALDCLSSGEYFADELDGDNPSMEIEDKSPQKQSTHYQLHAAIVHLGKSVHAGHYIAYIKRDGKWIYFNDSKVAYSTDPALSKGYIYIFKQN